MHRAHLSKTGASKAPHTGPLSGITLHSAENFNLQINTRKYEKNTVYQKCNQMFERT